MPFSIARPGASQVIEGPATNTTVQGAINALTSGRTRIETVKLVGSFSISSSLLLDSYTRLCACEAILTNTGLSTGTPMIRNRNQVAPYVDKSIQVCGAVLNGAELGTNISGIEFIRVSNWSFDGAIEVYNFTASGIVVAGVESGAGGTGVLSERTEVGFGARLYVHDNTDKGFYIRRASRGSFIDQIHSRRNGGIGIGVDSSEQQIGVMHSDANQGHGVWLTNLHSCRFGSITATRNGRHGVLIRGLVDSSIGSIIARGNSQNVISDQRLDAGGSSGLKWTAAPSGGSRYYLEVTAGGEPFIGVPYGLKRNGNIQTRVPDITGANGIDSAGKWAWGDNDSLGYNTIYFRALSDADPDTYTVRAIGYQDICFDNTNGTHGATTNTVIGEMITSTTADHLEGLVISEADATQLNGGINDTVDIITVDSAAKFPRAGSVLIDSEKISYTTRSSTKLYGCTRGAHSTSQVLHNDNAAVTLVGANWPYANVHYTVFFTESDDLGGTVTPWTGDPNLEGGTVTNNTNNVFVGVAKLASGVDGVIRHPPTQLLRGININLMDNDDVHPRLYGKENWGTSAIVSGQTSIVVAHGLLGTPAARDIYITPTINTTVNPGNIWVDTIGATNFTVNCRTDPSTSGMSFAWYAKLH